jgi:hypothetical protein
LEEDKERLPRSL